MSGDSPSQPYKASGRFEAIVDNVYDGVVVVSEQQRILWVNRALLEMFRYAADELIGQPIHRLLPVRYRDLHPGYVQSFRDADVQARPMYARAPVMGARRDGSEFACEISIAKIEGREGLEMTALIRDVSDQPRLREELERLCTEDRLSGLMNRDRFLEWLQDQLARRARFQEPFALVLFELDRLDRLVEQQGRAGADALVVALAGRFNERYQAPARLARLSDERFALLLPHAGMAQAMAEARALHLLIDQFELELASGEVVSVSATLGVLDGTPALGDDAPRVLESAERELDVVMRRFEDVVKPLTPESAGVTG